MSPVFERFLRIKKVSSVNNFSISLTGNQEKVYAAKMCPYCNSKTRVTTEKEIYKKTYKNRVQYCCDNFPKCDSYVGTHENGTPLGRLSNKRLRKLKIRAHKYFDKLYSSELITRTEAYFLLSKHLELPEELTHIGLFNEKTCHEVVKWSANMIHELKAVDYYSTDPR